MRHSHVIIPARWDGSSRFPRPIVERVGSHNRRVSMKVTTWIAAAATALLAAPALAADAGHYERVDVQAPSLAGNLAGDPAVRKVSVYLPPGYAKRPKQRYPVLYLLHGFTDSDANWFCLERKHFVCVRPAADAAFAAGVPEMIVVMPDAFTKF